MPVSTCPSCKKLCSLPETFQGGRVRCPACQEVFSIPAAQAAPPKESISSILISQSPSMNRRPLPPDPQLPHSGLGIASFLIAIVAGGMNVILILMTIVNASMARDSREGLTASIASGVTSLTCLNFLGVPLCILGAGLGFVGIVADKNRNHTFAKLGLWGNGAIVVAVMFFYVAGTVISKGFKS